jgi:hypothetical protein
MSPFDNHQLWSYVQVIADVPGALDNKIKWNKEFVL